VAQYVFTDSRFPNGTTLYATPIGFNDEPVSASVASGSATFSGLRELTRYVVRGQVSGRTVESRFTSPFDSSTGGSVPAGGTTGQVLKKNSSTDGDASWVGGGELHDVRAARRGGDRSRSRPVRVRCERDDPERAGGVCGRPGRGQLDLRRQQERHHDLHDAGEPAGHRRRLERVKRRHPGRDERRGGRLPHRRHRPGRLDDRRRRPCRDRPLPGVLSHDADQSALTSRQVRLAAVRVAVRDAAGPDPGLSSRRASRTARTRPRTTGRSTSP
jgi:hypothetical protein